MMKRIMQDDTVLEGVSLEEDSSQTIAVIFSSRFC